MNTKVRKIIFIRTPIAAAVASLMLASCTSGPTKPAGAAEVRGRLTQLQSNPDLANRAPVAIGEADVAVRAAERPEADAQLASHRVFMADRKVETARALAETRLAEDQRAGLTEQRESARLRARTQEADTARMQATAARSQAAAAQADSAEQRLLAEGAEQQAAKLQRQLDELQAKATDRGMVVTLGDVLFTSGQADLRAGAAGNLSGLVAFLSEYPDRKLLIEGYTDSVGSEDYNQGLSQRRADSVRMHLVGRGIDSVRLDASGRGESAPVASNESATGRQQNRRVEITIINPPEASR